MRKYRTAFIVFCLFTVTAAIAAFGSPTAPNGVKRAPNEMGLIPILMYHSVGGDAEFAGGPRYDKHGLNIAPETLKRQLQGMYEAGWYPVNMRDTLTARLNVPKGRTPVVLTFDDARPSQFRYLPNGTVDPNCAVGILEAFHRIHPDWPERATFYVLPESSYNGVPFDQDGLETKKLRFLVSRGYELGNHTTSHRTLAPMNAATIRWEMAFCARYFRRQVPHLKMETMALPYGIAPHDPALWHWLLDGSQGGTRYHNRCILLARGGPAFAPADKRFDPRRIPRVEAAPGEIEHWLALSALGQNDPLYVGDGHANTVTVPQSDQQFVSPQRLAGAHLKVSLATAALTYQSKPAIIGQDQSKNRSSFPERSRGCMIRWIAGLRKVSRSFVPRRKCSEWSPRLTNLRGPGVHCEISPQSG